MTARRILGRPRGTDPGGAEPLAALPVVVALRADLDRMERELIDAARRDGASWRAVAQALGLRSRQAAEQRWQRLRGHVASGDRQQRVDDIATAVLRHQVMTVEAQLALLAGSASVDRSVLLAQQTLAQAREAPSGALHDLARWAAGDLRQVPAEALGRALAHAVSRLAILAQGQD